MLIFVDLKFLQVDVLLSYVHYFNIRPKCVSRWSILLRVIHCDVTQFYLNRLVNNFLIILPEENFRTRIFLFSDIWNVWSFPFINRKQAWHTLDLPTARPFLSKMWRQFFASCFRVGVEFQTSVTFHLEKTGQTVMQEIDQLQMDDFNDFCGELNDNYWTTVIVIVKKYSILNWWI